MLELFRKYRARLLAGCLVLAALLFYSANLRRQNKDLYGIDIKITEEQSSDSEMDHTTEVVGYMVFAFIE